MNPTIPTAVDNFLAGAQFVGPTTLAQQSALLYWFFGGVFIAFCLCAFSLVIRATKGSASNVDL